MPASRTKFYLDKDNKQIAGVCGGIADYTGVDATLVRIGAVVLALSTGIMLCLIAYTIIAAVAKPRPGDLYGSADDAKFWQGVRSNPKRSTAEVRSKFRDIDRRLADIETLYTSRNSQLASEIDSLR